MGTIERGESNLSFSNLLKVSKALGVTLSQLLSGLEKRAEALTERPIDGPLRADSKARQGKP